MNHTRTGNEPDAGTDRDLEALLRTAGPRPQPPDAMAAQVRAAVEAEWRSSTAARTAAARRSPRASQRAAPWLMAASVAAVATGIWFYAPRFAQGPVEVATVARITGTVEHRSAGQSGWAPLAAAGALQSGDEIRTSAAGQVAVRRADGLEIRLDAGTTLAFEDSETAILAAGRAYVDSGAQPGATDDFTLSTPLGSVRHLGTQYLAAVAPGALQVAVREGSIAIEGSGTTVVARAGESLVIEPDGRVTRGAVASHGEAWSWAQAIAPEFVIEGRTLDEFLLWAARETGRQLVYASPETARLAETTQLRGSVSGLAPEDAVAGVLATTPALQHRMAGAQLRIEPAAD
jgi:ferric-dicitrate binding protein FerR (iron transport regulator)